MNSLMHMNSSKVVAILKKPNNKLETDTPISNIIDPTYNFSLNYQLKETALKIFHQEISNVTIESIYHVTRNMTVIPWGRR